MNNIRASKQLGKESTKFNYYFLAVLKEGAYIERQTVIVNNKEVIAYTLKKDLHATVERKNTSIIYGQLNFEAVKQFKNKGFNIRNNNQKTYVGGQTEHYFFSDYQKGMFNFSRG